MVAEFLESQGYVCTFTSEPAEGLRLLEEHDFDLVITDLMMGEVSGMEVLAGAHREGRKRASVILMTGFPTIENAIEALKQGAEDYLLKPFSLNALEIVVERVFDQIRLTRENVNLKESLALFRASEALEEPLDLPQYLDMVLDVAVQELGSSSANLVLFEQHEGIVREGERIHRGVPCPDLEEVGAVLSLASELSEASSEHVLNARMGGIPMLALPLRAGGDLVGLIAICREARESPFTPAEAKALAIIGSGAAVAIKNARLYNSLQEQYLGAVQALVAAVEAKDPYTRGHSEMVSRYGLLLAQASTRTSSSPSASLACFTTRGR